MDGFNGPFPDLHVMSKFPNLVEELRAFLPTGVKIISVEIADKRIKWDKSLKIEPQEVEAVKDSELLVIDSMILGKLLYELPKAKWVQGTWTGVEMIFESLDKSKPFPRFTLTRYVDPYTGELMANYVLAQIINIERGFYTWQEKQKMGKWARPFFPNFRVLSELTIGVLGGGKQGSTVANQLLSAGCNVISFVKSPRVSSDVPRHVFTTDLSIVLSSCDYICNVLPSTAETVNLLDGEVLKQCKKKPVFINIGRGDIIKEETIIRAVNEEWISYAILDVFEEEPLPSFSPLWNMPKVIITPHIGAIPRISGVAKMIAENYMRFVTGKELLNVVEWNKGY